MKLFHRHWPSLVTLLLLAFFFVILYPKHISSRLLVNDEADYAYAASQGIIANAWDINSLSWETFVNLGLGKGMKKGQYTNLSNFIRSSNAVTFYRHHHGPLYFYGLAAAMSISSNERWLRSSGLFWLLCMAAAAMLSLSIMFPQQTYWTSVLTGGLIGLSYNGFSASTILSGHTSFACFSIISLSTAGRWLSDNDRKWLLYSAVTGGIAFATIEYAILIPLSIFVATLLKVSSDANIGWKSIAIDAGTWACIAVASLLVVWPAGVIKFSIVKNYMVSAYMVLIRENVFQSNHGILSAWLERTASDPLTYGFVLISLLWSMRLLSKQVKLQPMIIFALLLFLSTIKNTSTSPTYIIALLGVTICLSVIGLGLRIKQFGLNFGLIVLPVLLAGTVLSFTRDYPAFDHLADLNWKNSIKGIAKFNQSHGSILVHRGYVPTLKYYYPELIFDSYAPPRGDMSEIFNLVRSGRYKGVSWYGNDNEMFRSEFKSHMVNYVLNKTEVRGLFLISTPSKKL